MQSVHLAHSLIQWIHGSPLGYDYRTVLTRIAFNEQETERINLVYLGGGKEKGRRNVGEMKGEREDG